MTGGSISDVDELTILEDSRYIEGDCVESDSVDVDCKKLEIEATTTGNTNFIFKIFGDATYV